MSTQETASAFSQDPRESSKPKEISLDTTHALLAPGQGHQKIGMGMELAKRSEAAAGVWQQVDNVLYPQLGYNLTDKVWNGTEEDIANNTQLAIITDALARKAAFEKSSLLGNPGWHAGNSLGLITALVNAGSLSIEGAAHLANGRKKAFTYVMNEGPKTTMVSLRDIDEAIVEVVKEKFNLVMCLINADSHIVVGGKVEDVNKAVKSLEDEHKLGDRNIFRLDVNAAYHSHFMEPAVPFWTEVVNSAPIEEPKRGIVIGGSTVTKLLTPDDIRRELILQLTNTERYRDVVKFLRDQGVTQMTELNEQRILSHINEVIFGEGSRQRIGLPADTKIIIGHRWIAPPEAANKPIDQEKVSHDSIRDFYIRWVANRAGMDPKEVSEDMGFIEGAGLDSEDLMALRAEVRAKYGRNVPAEEASELLTISSATDATYKLMNS